MRLNKAPAAYAGQTHEGARARRSSHIDELRRTVLACLLWEDNFYESGESVAARIRKLVAMCSAHEVAELAIEAREAQKLRHVPLLLLRELARDPSRVEDGLIGRTLARVIQRADEPGEFLSMYWAEGKRPIAAQVKKGLAHALRKFDEYQLAKYNRDAQVRLRDVIRLVHAKPRDQAQGALWGRLLRDELATPDTWEVALSGGADKKATFERLLREKKLGHLALLRNLRNMHQAGVDSALVIPALLEGAAASRALPFRYLATARAVPAWELHLDAAMQIAMQELPRLPGKTVLLIDVSGSMKDKLSSKSDLSRLDAAKALAILLRGVSDDCRVFKFNNEANEVPPRTGMALADAIGTAKGGTHLGSAVRHVAVQVPEADRVVVMTDEQSADVVGDAPYARGYMINVANAQNGVKYGRSWLGINGFSEAVVQYIQAYEALYPAES